MNIYEIDRQIAELVDENGEITDLDALDALTMERDKKVENVILFIKELTAEAEAMRQEEIALADRRRKAERNIERLKSYLDYALSGQKFSTPRCSISWRRTSSLDLDEAATMSFILANQRDDLLTFKDPEISKKAIKECIKAGEIIPGAAMREKLSPIIK